MCVSVRFGFPRFLADSAGVQAKSSPTASVSLKPPALAEQTGAGGLRAEKLRIIIMCFIWKRLWVCVNSCFRPLPPVLKDQLGLMRVWCSSVGLFLQKPAPSVFTHNHRLLCWSDNPSQTIDFSFMHAVFMIGIKWEVLFTFNTYQDKMNQKAKGWLKMVKA